MEEEMNFTERRKYLSIMQKRGNQVKHAISLIAKALDYPSAERLKDELVPMGKVLARHGELQLEDHLLQKLEKVSPQGQAEGGKQERREEEFPSQGYSCRTYPLG